LFCSMDTAVREYPELVQRYFMNKCVPPQDNKFSALHGAIWSGGSFVYIPPGVKVDLPLQAYFRMEGANEGTFEHTLIIADEGSEVNYIEGCTAQTYSVNSMHSAVVEIFVKKGAKVMHLAPETTLNILAKSISKDGGVMGYRGLVRMGHNSQGSKARVQCDGLMMDSISRSDTWPDIQIQNPHVTVAHEAGVGKI